MDAHLPLSPNSLITSRKRSLRRLCFYKYLSVQWGGGAVSASVHAGIADPQKQTPPGADMQGDTANKRAVRILLELYLFLLFLHRFQVNRKSWILHCILTDAYLIVEVIWCP